MDVTFVLYIKSCSCCLTLDVNIHANVQNFNSLHETTRRMPGGQKKTFGEISGKQINPRKQPIETCTWLPTVHISTIHAACPQAHL